MTTPPPGGFHLAFRAEAGCLEVAATGHIDTGEAVLEMFLRIAAELGKVRARMVLVLDETSGSVPDADEFRRVVSGVSGAGLHGVRIAYVDVAGTAVERIEVGEMIARDAGYTLRTFNSEALARVWLRYGQD